MKDTTSETKKSITLVKLGEELDRGPYSKGRIWSLVVLTGERIDEIQTCMICEWNLLFGRLDLAHFREKKDSFFLF